MAWRSEWVQDTADANVVAKERAIPVPLADKNWAQIQAGQAARPRPKAVGAKPPPSLDWMRGPLPPLHKDFYLSHPEPMLQCEEYFFGNLEQAHPVIGKRTEEEVEKFRQEHGICVLSMRGRPPPKPFQSFSETSFPDFVEALAYELFTKSAEPFPIQAQAWPCALSGADVIAVAPTGSGKTLAFLLPALVHVMAQLPLQRGEGPIALVLEPTRELAEQTLQVTRRFCERTEGDDTLRAGAVYGGVDPISQTPDDDAPDFGRWPELLIATPGRFVDLLNDRCWINPQRITYVVLDEADELLSRHTWQSQVRAALASLRPDRQLLLTSATWPAEAEAAALALCGPEVMKVRVDPAVPPIPQDVRLFPAGEDGDRQAHGARVNALLDWLRREVAKEESVLVLCQSRNTARELASSLAVAGALGEGTVALLEDSRPEAEGSAYWRFVRGEVRLLVATFTLGSRGLDYADTCAEASTAAAPLSLAVLLFDFPFTIKEYAHCIGRTSRPSQKAGRSVAFVPEMRFWIARELKSMLEHCGQPVPQELEDLIAEDRAFVEECRGGMLRLHDGKAPIAGAPLPEDKAPEDAGDEPGDGEKGGTVACGGDFDSERGVWILPPSLPSYRRKLLHWLADEIGLPHVSADMPDGSRRLHIATEREALPDKFFVEGEEVQITRGRATALAVVVDPRMHRRQRTIRVRFGGVREEADVPVETAIPINTSTEARNLRNSNAEEVGVRVETAMPIETSAEALPISNSNAEESSADPGPQSDRQAA